MALSQTGINLIAKSEGFSSTSYPDGRVDGVDKFSIGYGHQLTDRELQTGMINVGGKLVRYKSGISQGDAKRLLSIDAHKFNRRVEASIKVPLNQGQKDALTSFAYTTGMGQFKGSTLFKHVNSGNYDGATQEFAKWNKGTRNGKRQVLGGLVTRRANEASLFSGKTISKDGTNTGSLLPQEGDNNAQEISLVRNAIENDVQETDELATSKEKPVQINNPISAGSAAFGKTLATKLTLLDNNQLIPDEFIDQDFGNLNGEDLDRIGSASDRLLTGLSQPSIKRRLDRFTERFVL